MKCYQNEKVNKDLKDCFGEMSCYGLIDQTMKRDICKRADRRSNHFLHGGSG